MTLHRHLQPCKQRAAGSDATRWQKLPIRWWWCQAQVERFAWTSQSSFPALSTHLIRPGWKPLGFKSDKHKTEFLGFFTYVCYKGQGRIKTPNLLYRHYKAKAANIQWLNLASWLVLFHITNCSQAIHPIKMCWRRRTVGKWKPLDSQGSRKQSNMIRSKSPFWYCKC